MRRVKAAENRGELLIAYDLAMRGLARHPGNVDLSYLAVRVLARSGSTENAVACYERFKLGRQQGVDFAALGARLAKDAALGARAGRRERLLRAAGAYRKIFERTGDHYPAVNAATLYLLAGEERHALKLAKASLSASGKATAAAPLDRYYQAATRAEAALICRDVESARTFLLEAAGHLGRNYSAAATTRRQLRLVCRARRVAADVLEPIRSPMVIHYEAEAGALTDPDDQADAYLRRQRAGFAYGSLAAGGELRFAEACLAAGTELNVVLPFRAEEFVDNLVRPAGIAWVRRFRSCLERAHSVSLATTDSYQGDDDLIAYARRLAMGMALLRAQHLETDVRHVTIAAHGQRSDPEHLASWRERGLGVDVIAAGPVAPPRRARPARPQRSRGMPPRHARAILFGDVKGYSQVADHLVPAFQQHVMGAIATALRRFAPHVLYRNSWGDAIYVVIDDPVVGADCALAVQGAIANAKLDRFGFAARPELRLGAHFGPLYDGYDPVCEEKTFFGAHATIAARLEPVSPPGHVYVSEAMAAALAMAAHQRFSCDYVGQLPSAKGFGLMRMYLLGRLAKRQ